MGEITKSELKKISKFPMRPTNSISFEEGFVPSQNSPVKLGMGYQKVSKAYIIINKSVG